MPNKQRVHTDAPLTDMSVSYMQGEGQFVAGSIAPVIPVEKASDTYYVFPKESFFTDEAKPRAVGSKAAEGDYTISSDKYSCEEYAFRHPVFDRVRDNADSQVKVDRNGVNFVTRKQLIRIERMFVGKYFKTGVWATDVTGVDSAPGDGQVIKWSKYATSEPVKNVDAAKLTVLQNTGYEPNTGVIGYELFNEVKEHPVMTDKIKYTQKGIVTAELMAEVFGLQRLFVAKSVVNLAKKGQEANMQFNFGDGFWLGYVNPDPSPEMPSACYTFSDKNVSEGLGEGVSIRRYRQEDIRAEYFECEMSIDMKVVCADLGYFFNDLI